jgi:hypothetical protein
MANKIEELLKTAETSDDSSIAFEQRDFPSENECRERFHLIRRRLLDVRLWTKLSSASSYAHFDADGKENASDLSTGSFIRISVHGSGKYDWVKVEGIHEDRDEIVLTVQPTFDPTERPQKPEIISHFFLPTARNNFCLRRDGLKLSFYVIGLGEKQNTEYTDGLIETVRNAAAANFGYFLGLQKAMWTEFCKNMLSDKAAAAE